MTSVSPSSPMTDEPLTPIERLRLAIALTESYDDGVFECEPEYVEALLKEYDEQAETIRRLSAAPAPGDVGEIVRELESLAMEAEWAKDARTLKFAAQALRASSAVTASRRGIYIASKVRHADRWRFLRDKIGDPIISTWIDEAGEGETSDHHDLWSRCIREAGNCALLIVYREQEEVLKGAWIELGCALTNRVPVYAVGLEEYTVAKYRGITHFPTMKEAITASRQLLRRQPAEGLCEDCPRVGHSVDYTRCLPCPRRPAVEGA